MLYCSTTSIHPSILKTLTPHHNQLNPSKSKPSKSLRQEITTRIKCFNSRIQKKSEPRDYYEVLGVSTDSTSQQIKEAYRRLQKQHHPDIAGDRGHEYTLLLNEAYSALMREDFRRKYGGGGGGGGGGGKRREGFGSNFSGMGYSSWNGPVRPQALFVDENRCIGCRECAHNASETFMMDEDLGCARVRVQFGDSEKKIEVSVDSCPMNCIHWVESEELPLLEFLIRPQPKEAHGVFGGGWERPADVFAAAKYLQKQLKQQQEQKQSPTGQAHAEVETPAQAEARYQAGLKLQWRQFHEMWGWITGLLGRETS
ncbi:uncharacterized protein LOC109710296 [Ananas comosus]|uniref:Uncharacterized protein LOC109710296 n=1 Tax=Ananas comosus TaxID=4615 RepID=A0A6P5EY03_ANACO|nr:uncharacterized protein LOC109710296 [Ananas comosus]